ncbi:ferrous iron transport protein A [Clostridium estertheticum]|uniref:Ferrous iron transport protein A n=1 Tax=Clostridium estertheticum TaxID=238834 RepID=A0AA47I5Y3_9CLOT|nr:ferrous iron transport protein A [Clostridium estertheticum]MBU3155533.1 ferrous iron transport protein A [Clostridium estertheticum]MBU3198057.1 ferrous iron transport protein A [Clostridium estertheticum]WAG60068.1 ferrous iron transport protein A [Clostridium estertheticum]WAG65852.1 ferrous iron transport protein A [Clostridium estertheticum]
MENLIGLDKVDLKSRVKVVKIVPGSTIRRRIMDMGITIGVQIVVEGKAPMGDPIEIQVRGYKLSLRKNEAKDIMVELI